MRRIISLLIADLNELKTQKKCDINPLTQY